MEIDLVDLVKRLNDELYPGNDGEHRFGEITYATNYWCESISIGDHCLWDCNHPGPDEGQTIEHIVRTELREFCKFFGQAEHRVGSLL